MAYKKKTDSDGGLAESDSSTAPTTMKRKRRTQRELFVDKAPKLVSGAVKALRRLRSLAVMKDGGSETEWQRILQGLKNEINAIEDLMSDETELEPGISIFGSDDD